MVAGENDLPGDARVIAERAAAVFRERKTGSIEEARRLFAEAIAVDAKDVHVLFLAFQFHFRVGEYDAAEAMVRRRIAVIGEEVDSEDSGRAWCNLGLVHHHRGEFDKAEEMMNRAIGIDRRIGSDRGLARDVGNLALVYESRKQFDRAMELYRESLVICGRVGPPNAGAPDIAAGKWANMGDIEMERGQVEDARRHWTRAVDLFAAIGDERHRLEFVGKLVRVGGRLE